MAELKSCPFCGGEAELKNDDLKLFFSMVSCKSCGIRTPQYNVRTYASSDQEAIDAWNRRVKDE